MDTEDFVDEFGNTCDINVGYDCTDKNKYINTYGFTPEGWKDLFRNCPVSCNLCESGASRWLEEYPFSDPCVCMPAWSISKFEPTCANQKGCPAFACDNDPIGPWCLVVNPGCATVVSGESWAYCSPGTTVVPTEFYKISDLFVQFFPTKTLGRNPRLSSCFLRPSSCFLLAYFTLLLFHSTRFLHCCCQKTWVMEYPKVLV
jgi:hypothetical protein